MYSYTYFTTKLGWTTILLHFRSVSAKESLLGEFAEDYNLQNLKETFSTYIFWLTVESNLFLLAFFFLFGKARINKSGLPSSHYLIDKKYPPAFVYLWCSTAVSFHLT